MAKTVEVMIVAAMLIGQSAVAGLAAWWIASWRTRASRAVGGVFVMLIGWLSVVQVVNRLAGYPARSDLDINVLTLVALALGWLAGRNGRLQSDANRAGGTESPRLFLNRQVQFAGWLVLAVCSAYYIIAGIVGFLLELSIVSGVAGFWGVVIGLTLAPATFIAAPLYVGFHWHNWIPAILCYGCVVVGIIGAMFGSVVSR